AAKPFFHLLARRVRVLVEKSLASHHESRRAEPALLRVVLHESSHHGVQVTISRKAFNGLDIMTLRLDGQRGARINRFAVNDPRAGAAGGSVADPLGTGDVQAGAAGVQDGDAGLEVHMVALPVDTRRYWPLGG